jgi:hypothetical protein
MAQGQVYHAPFTATSASDWEPLDLCGVIVFGRDTRKYEIQDDASSEKSSLSSLECAETSGPSSSSVSVAVTVSASEESMVEESDDTASIAGSLKIREEDDLWFKLVEVDPHQKKPAKVVWRQSVLSDSSDYRVLAPFFHGLLGNVSVVFRYQVDVAADRIEFVEPAVWV